MHQPMVLLVLLALVTLITHGTYVEIGAQLYTSHTDDALIFSSAGESVCKEWN